MRGARLDISKKKQSDDCGTEGVGEPVHRAEATVGNAQLEVFGHQPHGHRVAKGRQYSEFFQFFFEEMSKRAGCDVTQKSKLDSMDNLIDGML